MKKLACAAFLALSLTLPAQAGHVDVFFESIGKASQYLNQYDYDKALAEVNTAEIVYHRILKDLANTPDQAEAYKVKLSLQSSLVMAYIVLGHRLFDKGRYQDALRVYDKSIYISPDFPCSHYEKGYTYQQLKQPWKAAVSLYEAQRLARFPARRNIVDHFDEEGGLFCGRDQVDPRSQQLLRDLGKSPLYPLAVDLKTGQQVPGRVLPGIGAHLVRGQESASVYLEQPLSEVLQNLGEPVGQEKVVYRDGRELPHYIYPDIMVVVDPGNQQVVGLYVYAPTAFVETPRGNLKVGAEARSVIKTLGQSFGFKKEYLGVNSDIRESLDYQELGLGFAIARNDSIKMLSIYTLE